MFQSRPVKVLYCIDALARGGTELQLMGMIKRLDRSNVCPILCTFRSYDTGKFRVDSPHFSLPLARIVSPKGVHTILKLARWLRQNNIEVVHTFFQDASIVGGLAARLAGTPVRIASFRDMGFWRTPQSDPLLKAVYRSMTGFIANSEMVAHYFSKEFSLDRSRFEVIYNGLDLEALPYVAHHGPTEHVAIVGNLNRSVKRTDLFIRAAAIVARQHPSITWHILGDGVLRFELERLTKDLGLEGQVQFLGSVKNVPDYLEKVQVGVISSDSEGLSNALLEYLCKGCAAVATNVGGNPELVQDGKTGLLVPPDDPESMARALETLITDRERRMQLAHSARKFVEDHFGWDKCISAHQALYAAARK